MFKKDYIDAVNEIKVTDKQKREVLNKMNQKPKKVLLKLSLCTACVVAIMIGVIITPKITKKPIQKITDDVVAENMESLPSVANYEELYAVLKEKATDSRDSIRLQSETNSVENSITDTTTTSNQESDFSKTNIQVEGVNEADIVKTDGKYIYYVKGNSLVIVDVQDKKNLKISSNIKFENEDFYAYEIYIEGDKLIVIGQANSSYKNMYTTSIAIDVIYSLEDETIARIYNIKDKTNVTLEREVKVDGYYSDSRMIGENLYLIANKRMYSICARYEIDELEENELLPTYTDTAVSEESKCVTYNNIYYMPTGEDSNYINIVSLNINSEEEANVASYIGAGNIMYVSTENLYVVNTEYNYTSGLVDEIVGKYSYTITTNIYKFKLDNEKVTFVCDGSVPGSVLNQFSMDESNGYFRIATTNSTSWDSETNTNNMYVLDTNLETVGRLEGLAPGERIYSVRFMGKKAYVVTFVQTDPLFVIDLSEPTNPTVLGELKIPGFSNYLHPYDENHIIGFGQDTKVKNYGYGEVTVTDGIKMAMFDVSDVNNPKEMYNVKIGDSGTFSELLYNHKALLFSKEKGILAFPISIFKDESSSYVFQGAIVYDVDLENGFTLKGQISHKSSENGSFSYDTNRIVERIIYIDNNLITLSPTLIKVNDINTIETISEMEIK